MRGIFFGFIFMFSLGVRAAEVSVDVVLNPMGNFKIKTQEVIGQAEKSGVEFSAKNIRVNLKSLTSGIELRDKHIQKHLETSKFPEAELLVASGKNGKGVGKIKIRGVEKDIEGVFKAEGSKLMAKFHLKLSDFGISDISYMGVGVEDEITILVSVPVMDKK